MDASKPIRPEWQHLDGLSMVWALARFRYIEEQLDKRKNSKLNDGGDNNGDSSFIDDKYLTAEESALLSLPEHLRISSSIRSEEMLSNQMLNGIPEIDLGIEVKIKNIEATEAAKERLIQEQKNKKVTAQRVILSHSFRTQKLIEMTVLSIVVGAVPFCAH